MAENNGLVPWCGPTVLALAAGRSYADATAMLRAEERHGAQIHRFPVAALQARDGAVRGVTLENCMALEADETVLAAGAWAPPLLAPLGLELAVQPQRGQILHLRLPGVDTRHWPVLLPMSSHYLLAFDDSRVVVGATRETGSGFDHRFTAAGIRQVAVDMVEPVGFVAGGLRHRAAGADQRRGEKDREGRGRASHARASSVGAWRLARHS